MKRTAFFVSIILLTGCTLNTNYFSDYIGKNLLANFDLSAVDSSVTPDVPVWKTLTEGVDTTPGNDLYMSFTQVGLAPADTVGPDGISPAYRLEVKNLFPNGDFETALDMTTPLWQMQNVKTGNTGTITQRLFTTNTDLTNPTTVNNYSAGMTPIKGQSLFLDTGSDDDQMFFNLKTALGPTLVSGGIYQMHLDLRTIGSLYAHFYDLPATTSQSFILGSDSDGNPNSTDNYQTVQTMPNFELPATTRYFGPFNINNAALNYFVSFGFYPFTTSSKKQTVIVDNLQLVRIDSGINPYLQISLPSLSSPGAALLPGIYNLSFYVKNDPLAGINNVFAAKNISIKVFAYTKNNTNEQVLITTIGSSTGWPGWSEIKVSIPKIDFADKDPPAGSGIPVLRIQISPSSTIGNPSLINPESLLISQPRLEFAER